MSVTLLIPALLVALVVVIFEDSGLFFGISLAAFEGGGMAIVGRICINKY